MTFQKLIHRSPVWPSGLWPDFFLRHWPPSVWDGPNEIRIRFFVNGKYTGHIISLSQGSICIYNVYTTYVQWYNVYPVFRQCILNAYIAHKYIYTYTYTVYTIHCYITKSSGGLCFLQCWRCCTGQCGVRGPEGEIFSHKMGTVRVRCRGFGGGGGSYAWGWIFDSCLIYIYIYFFFVVDDLKSYYSKIRDTFGNIVILKGEIYPLWWI